MLDRRRNGTSPRVTSHAPERAKALAQSGQHTHAGTTKFFDQLHAHQIGARVHEIERLRRTLTGFVQEIGIAGRRHGLAVIGVADQHDGIDIGSFSDNVEAVRETLGVVAGAPSIERIAGAADRSDHSRCALTPRRIERWKLECGPFSLVENHLDLPARSGHHTDPRSCRPTRRLAAGQNFSHLIERRDLDTVMPRDQRREHATIACYPAGMTNHGFTRKGAAANLERDHRLADLRCTIERRGEALDIPHRLDEQRDHLCLGIVDQELDVLIDGDDCFVARRNQVAEAEATTVAQHANCDRPALSDQRDVAPEATAVEQSLEIQGAVVCRAEYAHAIGPAQRHTVPSRQCRHSRADRWVIPCLVADCAIHHAAADAFRSGLLHNLGQRFGIDTKRDRVDLNRHLGETAEALDPQHGLVAWMNRRNKAGEAELLDGFENPAAGCVGAL